MTIKEILENGYGIDFESIQFNTLDGSGSVRDIKDSLANNEIVIERDDFGGMNTNVFEPIDYDIDDVQCKTTLYLEEEF